MFATTIGFLVDAYESLQSHVAVVVELILVRAEKSTSDLTSIEPSLNGKEDVATT